MSEQVSSREFWNDVFWSCHDKGGKHLACEKFAVGAALALEKFLGGFIRSWFVRDHAPEFGCDMHVCHEMAVFCLGGNKDDYLVAPFQD